MIEIGKLDSNIWSKHRGDTASTAAIDGEPTK